jgi:hypothetical protein
LQSIEVLHYDLWEIVIEIDYSFPLLLSRITSLFYTPVWTRRSMFFTCEVAGTLHSNIGLINYDLYVNII